MIPRPPQIKMAAEVRPILEQYGLAYLAAEERTGKTLAAILAVEDITNIKTVLVITKKNAIAGWVETLSKFGQQTKDYVVTNYHNAYKYAQDNRDGRKPFDLVILDEAHSYISGFPKRSQMWKNIKLVTRRYVLYISATPHAQGRHMLYNQFALSRMSPWKDYKTGYQWFNEYGIPHHICVNGIQIKQYNKCQEERVRREVEHLFVTCTRKEAAHNFEPEDELHQVSLSDATKVTYNAILKERIYTFKFADYGPLVCDTIMKLRTSLHMLEGGVAKIGDQQIVLPNTEKIDYILKKWGDSSNVVIFYQYIAEGVKLREVFKQAQILQGTSYAEGVDLSDKEHLIIYSQDFSTARHSQRRARQANVKRTTPITVHYLLCEGGISEAVYERVSINKVNFVDTVFQPLEVN